LFPVLFVTIACGAVSGFHSLVAGGTTSKQVKHPRDLKFLGYGGMIMEGVLALISLAAVMIIGKSQIYNNPNSIFAGGFSTFTRSLGTPMKLGSTFALLALSTFLLTSMDSSTRIARYILQEFFHKEDWLHKILYTVAVLILPLVMIFVKMPDAAHPGQYLPVYKAIWPVFGASQQLLAGLCLLVIYIIRKHKNKSTGFVFWPMIFMIFASIVGIIQIMIKYVAERNYSIVVLSFILLIMAYVICHDVIANKIKEKKAKK
ncbi:MAG: carbon starvation protein A, partial [Armatimonadetes bacterium]|nr:carbon starvation protein A [Candidatus Hippobium faecium]